MSLNIQNKIEAIRNQTQQYGNTRQKVADVLTDLNKEKIEKSDITDITREVVGLVQTSNGWYPVYEEPEVTLTDGSKATVRRITDYKGGVGAIPAFLAENIGKYYAKAGGFTIDVNLATNYKGIKGSDGTGAAIATWTAQSYTGLVQVVKDDKIWELPSGQTATASDVPGTSNKWIKKIGGSVAATFDPNNDTDGQGGKQIYEWFFGIDGNIELGTTTSVARSNMDTTYSANKTITYWMYQYIPPFSKSILSEFQINVESAADIYIKRYKKSGSGSSAILTFQDQKIYTVAAGMNTINILTQPDKSGEVNNLWKWESDDVIALYCSGGLKYTTETSYLNGLWGYSAIPSNTTGNFTVSQLTAAPGGILLSLKFTELVSAPIPGKVVDQVNTSNALDPELIPNVAAVIDYVDLNSSKTYKLTDIILVPSFGQSLAGGTDGGSSTFSAPIDIAFTTGNVNSNVQDMNGGFIEAFKEAANRNNFKLPTGFKFMSSVAYLGGTCITDLSKGTATYNSLISQVQTAKNTANSLGKTFSVPAFCWTQGEEDYRAGGSNGANYGTGKYIPTEYATKLSKLIDDLNADIKAITGQKEDVLCIMYQVASHNPYGRYPRIAIEQLKAAIYDKRISLAKTMYDIEYNSADNVHAPNKTYRNMGNYYGIALFDAVVKKERRMPIYPIKSQRVGNVVYIQFHVPVKPLVFDEVWVSPLADGKKGFNLITVTNEFTTSATIATASTTITNVELISADTVKITMSGVPATGTRLTYGVNGQGWDIINGNTSNGTRRSGRTEGARGNLRDSQTYFNPVSNYFNLYNWAPIFEIII